MNEQFYVNTIGHWQGIEKAIKELFSGGGQTIEVDFSEIITELNKIENGQTSAAQQLTELETLMTSSNTKLDSVKTAVDGVKAEIITSRTNINNVVTAVNALGGKIDTVNTALTGMKTVMDNMLTVLQAIQTNTSGISTTINTLNTTVASQGTRLDAVEARTNFPLQEETATTLALTPNVYHKWGEVASLNLTFTAGSNPDIVDEYVFEFVSGTTATVLTLPESVKWIGDSTIEPSKTYVVTVVNNLAVLGGA